MFKRYKINDFIWSYILIYTYRLIIIQKSQPAKSKLQTKNSEFTKIINPNKNIKRIKMQPSHPPILSPIHQKQ